MSDCPRRDTPLRPNPEVVAKRLDQATVLVDISTSRIFELNETGTRLWEMLGQGLDVERIVQQLVHEFNVAEAEAAAQVNRLLVRLQTEGLVSS